MKNAALIVLGLMSLSPFAAQAGDIREIAQFSIIEEIDELEASIAADPIVDGREARAMQKILRKFDRQYDRFARRIRRILKQNDDEDLLAMFQHYHVRTGSVLAELGFDEKMEVPTDGASLRIQLQTLTSPLQKALFREQLIRDVQASGSAHGYLQNVRQGLRGMNPCLWKKASLTLGFAALGVAGVAGVISQSVVVNFLTFFIGGLGGVVGTLGSESPDLACRLEFRK